MRVLPVDLCDGHVLDALQVLGMQNVGGSVRVAGAGLVVVGWQDAREGVFHPQLAVEGTGHELVGAEVSSLF